MCVCVCSYKIRVAYFGDAFWGDDDDDDEDEDDDDDDDDVDDNDDDVPVFSTQGTQYNNHGKLHSRAFARGPSNSEHSET